MAGVNAKFLDVAVRVCDTLIAHEEQLNDLDRKIGDGDHGTNIHRGCQAIKELLPSLGDADVPTVLNKCAMVLLGKVGGASGPLLASGLLEAAKVLPKDAEELAKGNKLWFLRGVEAFMEGIKKRGHAEPGDKTFIDYLDPFVRAFGHDYETLHDENLKSLVQRASVEGNKGLDHTGEIAAKKGRASYLGDRSIGTKDPGATTLSLVMNAIVESL